MGDPTDDQDRQDLHRMIRESISAISADYDWDYWLEHARNNEFPTEFWDDLADGGWFGVVVPEAYGGQGLGLEEMMVVTEELQRGGARSNILVLLASIFGPLGVQRHGTEAQKNRYLPAMAAGEERWCLGVTEPNAGTNTLRMDTRAERDGDEFVIDGGKVFISGVDVSDAMLLATRTSPYDPDRPTHGVTLFMIPDPADRDDVRLTPVDIAVDAWVETQFQVELEGVRVDEDRVLGEVDRGMGVLFDTLNPERISGAVGSIGEGLRAIDLAVAYANDRRVWSEPIGAHQSIQHPLADAYSKLKVAREMAYKAARLYDRGEECGEQANIANLRASTAAYEAAHHAVQTHGGNGFTDEYEVFHLWEATRAGLTAPVSSQMVKNHLAEHALGLPRSYARE